MTIKIRIRIRIISDRTMFCISKQTKPPVLSYWPHSSYSASFVWLVDRNTPIFHRELQLYCPVLKFNVVCFKWLSSGSCERRTNLYVIVQLNKSDLGNMGVKEIFNKSCTKWNLWTEIHLQISAAQWEMAVRYRNMHRFDSMVVVHSML